MKMVFIVNETHESSAAQTTTMLALNAAMLGVDVFVAGVAALGLSDEGRVLATCYAVGSGEPGRTRLASALAASPTEMDLCEVDVIRIRTNPARDRRAWAHQTMSKLTRIARDAGVEVLNDPVGLERASTKLYMHHVPPEFRPRTLVTGCPEQIKRFVSESPQERSVIKPLVGTRGQDVFLVDGATEKNLNALIDVLVRDGYAIAQDYVPEAVDGDTRLVILDGQLVEVGGAALAVRRIPSGRDFRSNVHVGGRDSPAVVTDQMRACVAAVGPLLVEDGLRLVGGDFIGGKLVELNVFSTGGFADAEEFYGQPFTREVVERVVASIGGRP